MMIHLSTRSVTAEAYSALCRAWYRARRHMSPVAWDKARAVFGDDAEVREALTILGGMNIDDTFLPLELGDLAAAETEDVSSTRVFSGGD